MSPDGYDISVYLLPSPADGIDVVQSGQNQCCGSTPGGVRTGTIRLLTRSAAVWQDSALVSSLGLLKSGDDYHAKVLVSEYIPIGHYAVQDARQGGGWRYYDAPAWFVQGLQEYDGIFHSTEGNRANTSRRLFRWAKTNMGTFACCSQGLVIADPYNGGAAFMAFLASEFGEDVHTKLLQNPSATFEAALADVTQPYALPELFERFERWVAALQS